MIQRGTIPQPTARQRTPLLMLLLVLIIWLSFLNQVHAGEATSKADSTTVDAALPCTAFRAYPGPTGLRQFFETLPDAPLTIVAATVVPAQADQPEYCKIEGYAAASIGFEVRMPTTGWNDKFLQQGCGAMCGSVSLAGCEDVLARNYAVASTDMGHKSTAGDVKWARNNLQAQIDFGYRATHVATVAAKAIVEKYYGRPAKLAYFRGCSTGGRQAMVEAERYPDDYDGIIAGAPPLDEIGDSLFHLIWTGRATQNAAGEQILDSTKLKLVHEAVMAACDGQDGPARGFFQDPGRCSFKLSALRCADSNATRCLSDAEIGALQNIYQGARRADGTPLYDGGMPLGSEDQWAPQLVGPPGEIPGYLYPYGFIAELMRYLAFDHALPDDYPLVQFDIERDAPRLATMEALYDAQNPDLTRFKAHGGKLILWHGWDDIEIPATVSIAYYKKVEALMGGRAKTQDFFRLYLVPGVAHCRRGPGADAFDELGYLEAWVERGQAPDVLTAYHLKTEQSYLGLPRPRFPMDPSLTDWSRPVYPYPYYAKYAGHGDSTLPSSWVKARLSIAGPAD